MEPEMLREPWISPAQKDLALCRGAIPNSCEPALLYQERYRATKQAPMRRSLLVRASAARDEWSVAPAIYMGR